MTTGTRPDPKLVLASASPRRQMILRALGLDFEILSTGLDEEAIQAETPRARVMKIAVAKAAAGADRIVDAAERPRLIVAADTEVILDGKIFGKPSDRADAIRMLGLLSGRTHDVITAVALKSVPGGEVWIHAERTAVTFHVLETDFIAEYVSTGETDDKAGAYGIQGMGGQLIAGFEGSISNVIGLPLATLAEGLRIMLGRDIAGATRNEREVLLRAFPDMGKILNR